MPPRKPARPLSGLKRKYSRLTWAGLSRAEAMRAERDAAQSLAARLKALYEVAALVSSTLEPQGVFESVAEATSRLLEGAVAFLRVWDAEGERLTLRAGHGIDSPEFPLGDAIGPSEGLSGWVYRQRQALLVPDALADPRTVNRARVEAKGLRAFVCVPLLLRDRCLGVLSAWRAGARPFGAADVELLWALAGHAAAAIENARLYEQEQAERERLRAILELMPEAVLVAEGSLQGRTIRRVMANRACMELLRSPEPLPAARTEAFEMLHPDGSPFEEADLPLRRAIWHGQPVRDMEILVRFFDGTQRSLLASVALVRESAGLRQAVAVFQDITVRKLLEDQTEFEAARLAAIMDTIPEPLFILDAESGVVLHANRAASEFRGDWPMGSPLSNLGFRLLSADGARELLPSEWPHQRAFRGDTVRGEEVICEFPGGRRAHYLFSAAPVQHTEGRRRQAVLIGADLSTLKRAEAEL